MACLLYTLCMIAGIFIALACHACGAGWCSWLAIPGAIVGGAVIGAVVGKALSY